MHQFYKDLFLHIGENPEREGLKDTPQRAFQAFEYLTKGYKENLEDIINNALFPSKASEMVIVKNIELYSMCEHHLLPFFGKCHIGYLPNGKVLGVSKLARIVDYYARRLQIQESLTQEIAECIEKVTESKGVGVVIEAQHLCMMMRGVEKQNSVMKTSVMLGQARENINTRMEFLDLIK
jgi:GTP cyclohydrolase I